MAQVEQISTTLQREKGELEVSLGRERERSTQLEEELMALREHVQVQAQAALGEVGIPQSRRDTAT